MNVTFVDPLIVSYEGKSVRVGDVLTYHPQITEKLHSLDRVHTYGSFYLATLGQEVIEDTAANQSTGVLPANRDEQEETGTLIDSDRRQPIAKQNIAVN